MWNDEKKNSEIPNAYYSLYNNNYLANCYKYMIRAKSVHFIVTLVEILLNILEELFIAFKEFNAENNFQKNFLGVLAFIPEQIKELSMMIRIIIILLYLIVFDGIYYFLGKIKCKKDYKHFSILYNVIELFFFRISMILFLNIFCSLSYYYFVLFFILSLFHLYITTYHFLYNHLYIFVPFFIEYPYDEFSSIFDLLLLSIKILLSIMGNSKNFHVIHFLYIITFIFQIIICIYFIYYLINRSYLFMKNLFLNKTKVALFLIQTSILLFVELIGKKSIFNISFIFILIFLFLIILLYINLLYNPINYIRIKKETPNENMYFYFYLLSSETHPFLIIEKNISIHYEVCGICNLCIKFKKYLKKNKDLIEIEESMNYISRIKPKKKDKLINEFFNILYEGNNKYFFLIKELMITYKEKTNGLLDNNSYFYINLSFLIFSELKNKNYILALNIKILLDYINNTNKFLDIHEEQILQITLCNKFLSLVNSTLTQIKAIMKTEENKAIKFFNLSKSLKYMKDIKYKEILFNHKHDDISNSKNLIYLCALLYEEIFNTILNTNQIPLRENYQLIEDLIYTNKIEKIISLALDLNNKECKIIRAGRDLYSYKDINLFDLIPLIFKDHFEKTFIKKIIDNFNFNYSEEYKEKKFATNSYLKVFDDRHEKIFQRSTIRRDTFKKNYLKKEFMEFKMIISEEILDKVFYKLLTLKLTPLFNNNYNSCYILLDGSFKLGINNIITLQDIRDQLDKDQKIISVSKPELEYPPEIYSMKFQKYIFSLEKKNYKLSKIFDFVLGSKIFSIYSIFQKDKDFSKKPKRSSFCERETIKFKITSKITKNDESIKEKINAKKLEQFIEDNASVQSQKTLFNTTNVGAGFNIKIRKKQDVYRDSKLYKIEKILYLMIPIIIIFSIIEIYHLSSLKNGDYTNNYSLVYFSEFYKLYFQLFSSILSVVCIKYESGCVSIMKLYLDKNPGLENYFNFTQYFYGESQVLMKKMLLKKNNLVNLHTNIGKKNYEKIFEQKVNYTRISKEYTNNGEINLVLMKVNMIFTEAILIAINSFQILTNNTINEEIYLLNKKEKPFLYFDNYENNYGKNIKDISDFQKEFYEMILNYKIFWEQFRYVYYKLLDALSIQTINIKFYIYFYFNLSYVLIVFIMIMLYIYMYCFELLVVKMLNYVNMLINNNYENFNFYKEFSKKIENLNNILKIYDEDPIKSIQNLITSYNKYDKYLSNKKRNLFFDINKKGNKKPLIYKKPKNILDEVPEHLKIIKKCDINNLYITYHYYLLFVFLCLFIIVSYIPLYLMWEKYYLIKDNLYSLLKKDTELEISFYKAINIYNLMIFDNCTLDDLAKDIFYDINYVKKDRTNLIKSLYDDLYLVFNYEIEIRILVSKFASGFPYFFFACDNMYSMESDYIEELEKNSEIKKIGKLYDKLLTTCTKSGLDFNHDIANAFANHHQAVIYAVTLINDFSYSSLIAHLKKGIFGQIYLNFNLILNFITDIINVKLHKVEYDNLLGVLTKYLITTIIILVFMYVGVLSTVIFVYVSKLKKSCEQIILLKQVFKLCEVNEQ